MASSSETPLRVLIVDDEAPARSRLRDLLGDVSAEQPNLVASRGQSRDMHLPRSTEPDAMCRHCDPTQRPDDRSGEEQRKQDRQSSDNGKRNQEGSP